MNVEHCCERMRDDLAFRCDRHPSRFDCPDCLIHYSAMGKYGLIVHDGGSSSIAITFCPWCGRRLTEAE